MNLYAKLIDVIGAPSTLVGVVSSVNGDGTVTLAMIGGGSVRIKNAIDSQDGDYVFFSGDKTISKAPTLPLVVIEV